jgi:mono/diheme cytochrome c family protein
MNRVLVRCAAVLVTLSPFLVASWVHAQQNGEAQATIPTVVRTDYDMRTFVAPLPLNETELKGRKRFAQRCANCHGGTAQRPGPLLGQQTVERLGDSSIREKVGKGSQMMPGFAYSLEPAQIDQIIAFLKTVVPQRDQTAVRE